MPLLQKAAAPSLITIAPDEGAWQTFLPLFDYRLLHLENSNGPPSESGNLRLQAGAQAWLCGLRMEIEILIQTGSMEIDGLHYQQGDFCVLPDTTGKWRLASADGALCFIRRQGAALHGKLPWLESF